MSERGIALVPLLFELAHVGHLLDPTTESTEPQFANWHGDNDRIAAFQEELRRTHLAEVIDS